MNRDILIIDDDAEVRVMVAEILEDEGYSVRQADDWESANKLIRKKIPDLVFLDLWIGNDENAGIRILDKIKKINSYIPVVMISGHGNIEVAVCAIKKGAYDFIEKPFVIERLLLTANRAIESNELLKENVTLKSNCPDMQAFFAGTSKFLTKLNNEIKKIAPTNMRIMICGPKGCFPEVVANIIHKESLRAKFPFIEVDCSANTPDEVCNQLFGGYGKNCAFLNAHGGTIFLKEVLSLSEKAQQLLSDYLNTGLINGNTINARVLCYTSEINKDGEISEEIGFSKDLFKRLNVQCIKIVPLRERTEDILDIADYYISNAAKAFNISPKPISEKAKKFLLAYPWSDEFVQLKNAVEFALLRAKDSDEIDIKSFPREIYESNNRLAHAETILELSQMSNMSMKEAKQNFEKEFLKFQILRFENNITKLSLAIGVDRSSLYKKMKSLGIGDYGEEG